MSNTAQALDLTYHDPDKAIKQAEHVLQDVFFKADAKSVYLGTTGTLKSAITPENFQFLIEQLVYSYPHKNITIYAHELYGAAERIAVFAKSQVHEQTLFYSLFFSGSDIQGYKLENLRITSNPLPIGGMYQKLDTPKYLESEFLLNRLIDLPNSKEISIEAVTKTFFESENIYAYTLKYRADVDMENHQALQALAKAVMDSYAGDKATAYGSEIAVMTVSKASRLDDPNKPIQAFRTLFKYEGGEWLRWK
ncbi:hypothetical protein GCM10009332_13940 [Shewanella gelidii]|uniref:Uncharacterized protein n=2 Tax=Shewanella gelidii TaxID=1642821 RepID=A0A917JQM1_9GAMM|nr:hypothetical protein GCM10009332_13940 [Shewanella gelidii]